MVDEAIIIKILLLNLLVSTYGTAPVFLKVHYCYRHIAGGGKKDVDDIAKIFLPDMERLNLEKNRFDLFIFDGASNVQGAGGFFEAVFLGSIISTGQSMFCLSSLEILQRYLRLK